MKGRDFTESTVEQAALDWLAGAGWQVAHRPGIAPDIPNEERSDYGQVRGGKGSACKVAVKVLTLHEPVSGKEVGP